jgi:hypothetical protein
MVEPAIAFGLPATGEKEQGSLLVRLSTGRRVPGWLRIAECESGDT